MKMWKFRPDMVRRRGGARCVEVARKLQGYLDGELDDTTREHIAGHLAVCRRCGMDEQAYRDIKAALARRDADLPAAPIDRLRAFAESIAAPDEPDGGHPRVEPADGQDG